MFADYLGLTGSAILALLPDQTPDVVWIFRGIITASLLLNLHFLRKVYLKVGRVDTFQRQIATIIIAVEYLAREAITNGGKRESDSLILNLLDDVKSLNEYGSPE